MKKTIYLISLFIILSSFNFISLKFSKLELEIIKLNYNWKTEKYLIINYFMPKNYCDNKSYYNPKRTKDWFNKNIFTKIKLNDSKNIFVYSDSYLVEKELDNKIYFKDINDFYLNKVFSKNDSCNGLIIINQEGKYDYFEGEYTSQNVEKIINQLK